MDFDDGYWDLPKSADTTLGGQAREGTYDCGSIGGIGVTGAACVPNGSCIEGMHPLEAIAMGATPLLNGAGAVTTLNTVMSALTDEIVATDGYVNKFLGDGIMAFWSAFAPQPDQAARAVRAAMRCQERMRELNARPGMEGLSLRIGLSMGKAIVGDCGAPPRLNDYTAIGDVVNLAARLESANKQFGRGILIEGSLADAAVTHGAAMAGLRSMGRVVVVGQSNAVLVWTVVPDRGEQERALWTTAVDAFAASRHAAAANAWHEYAATFGPSKVAQAFLDALAAGTPADGVLHLRAK